MSKEAYHAICPLGMSQHAKHAVRAAQNRHKWGAYATSGYLRNHNVSRALYVLARALEADKK